MSNMISLEKKLTISLEKAGFVKIPKMEVKALIDKSGSMSDEFACGWVQSTLDLFLAAALKFDDDGALQVGFFNTLFDQTPDMVESDAGVYVKKYNIRATGGTYFAEGVKAFKADGAPSVPSTPVVEAPKVGFFGRMFGSTPAPQVSQVVVETPVVKSGMPTYIAMITDGENGDKREFEQQLSTLGNTFLQIIGIGNQVDKRYLDRVANMYDNVSVMYIPNPAAVDDAGFYDMLFNSDLKKFIGA